MNEQQIQQIVIDELNSNAHSGAPIVPRHTHDGNNSPKVNQSNIIPNVGAMGKITFSSNKNYTLNFPKSNPSFILFNGFALNNTPALSTIYAYINGNAVINPTSYFQPVSSSNVQTGGLIYPVQSQFGLKNVPAQCSSCLVIDSSSIVNSNPHVDQFRIVNVFLSDASNPATGVLNNLTTSSVQFNVTLTGSWQIVGNFTII